MVRLLIADDEFIVCEGIKNSIDWENYQVEVVGFAVNGIDALQLARETLPEIVISDIKMPGLDGLQLVERLKSFLPDVQVILISAYEEFDYAKQAIRLGVNSYLSKPVKKAEIIHEVSKLRAILEQKKQAEETASRLRQRFLENLPILKEHFLNSLIIRKDVRDIEVKLQTYQIDLVPHNIGVIVWKADRLPEHDSENADQKVQLLMLRISESVAELLYPTVKGITFQSYDQEMVTLYNGRPGEDTLIAEVVRQAELIKDRIFAESNLSISIGIGRIYPDFKEVGLSYQEAVKALNYRLVYGGNLVLYIENVENLELESYGALRNINDLLENFQNILYTGKVEELDELVGRIAGQLRGSQRIPYYYIQQVYVQLLSMILRTAAEIGITPQQITGESDLYGKLLKIEYFQELEKWFKTILVRICQAIQEKNKLKTKHAIAKATDYIQKHCQEELSLTTVAEYVRLSPAYFSRFFKEETGCSFVDYLKRLRIEKAKELLQTSNLKIYEICEALGYQSVQYFSNLFKTMVGVTPQEYREKIG